jgi:hypothetical protein
MRLGVVICCLALLSLGACVRGDDDAHTLVLPAAGPYYYWVSSAKLVSKPQVLAGSPQARLTLPQTSSPTTFYILDARTGRIASLVLPITAEEATLTPRDFRIPTGVSPPPAAFNLRVPAAFLPHWTWLSWLLSPLGIGVVILVLLGVLAIGLWLAARKLNLLPKATPRRRHAAEPVEARAAWTGHAVERVPEEALDMPRSRSSALFVPGKGERRYSLIGMDGSYQGVAYPITHSETRIGRGQENHVILSDVSVSRRHACIRLERGGRYVLRDRGSSNGIQANGRPVDRHYLQDGDILQIGNIRFRFEEE